MIPVTAAQPNPARLVSFLKEAGRPTLEVNAPSKVMPSFAVGEEVTAKIVDTYGANRFTVMVKDKLMTLTLDGRHALTSEPGGTLKLVVASIDPRLTFALDAKAPMRMPDSSSKVLLSPATRYLATLLFVATPVGVAVEETPALLPESYTNAPTSLSNAETAESTSTGFTPVGTQVQSAKMPPLPAGLAAELAGENAAVAADPATEGAEAAILKTPAQTLSAGTAERSQATSKSFSPFATLQTLLTGYKAGAAAPTAAPVQVLFELPENLTATSMAHLLKSAVSKSGLFYEAHLAEWTRGDRSVATLRQEPQAAIKLPEKLLVLTQANAADTNPSIDEAIKTGSATGLRDRELSHLRQDSQVNQLSQLVQKQMDAIDNRQFVWQGQAWPGQPMDWRIDEEQVKERNANGEPEESRWSTSLTLELPTLGGLAAKINITPAGVMVRFQTDSPEAAAAIESEQQRLRQGFGNAGLSLLMLTVTRGQETDNHAAEVPATPTA